MLLLLLLVLYLYCYYGGGFYCCYYFVFLRFDNVFIKEQIENFDWDFGELSYQESDFVISLLSNKNLKDRNWDWNYLSKTLPDEYIENHIEDISREVSRNAGEYSSCMNIY